MTPASGLRQRNAASRLETAEGTADTIGTVATVCSRAERSASIRKPPVTSVLLDPDRGVVGDVHSGPGERQVALIALADLDALRAEVGARFECGAMGENLVVDAPPSALVPGARLAFASGATIEVTRPRTPCVELEDVARGLLRASVGRAGLFARVLVGGEVREGDTVRVAELVPAAIAPASVE
mgnify:CR=1 FL=1